MGRHCLLLAISRWRWPQPSPGGGPTASRIINLHCDFHLIKIDFSIRCAWPIRPVWSDNFVLINVSGRSPNVMNGTRSYKFWSLVNLSKYPAKHKSTKNLMNNSVRLCQRSGLHHAASSPLQQQENKPFLWAFFSSVLFSLQYVKILKEKRRGLSTSKPR